MRRFLSLALLEDWVQVKKRGLAGVAQWTERRPVNQKVASSIPSSGTCLGCGPGPQWGAEERQLMFLSLSFSLPSPLKLIKIKCFKKIK